MLRFQRPLGTCSGFALTQAEWPWVDHGSCELSLGFSIWMGRAGLADFQGAVQQWCGFAHRRRMDRGYLFPTTFSNEPNCAVLAMSTCSERDVRNSTPSLFLGFALRGENALKLLTKLERSFISFRKLSLWAFFVKGEITMGKGGFFHVAK